MTFSLETYPYRLLSALRFVYFGKLLQKHLLFELHVILSEILFVSEFQSRQMIGLTSSLSASTRKGEGTVGCQYLCRETNSFVQTSKVERAQVKQIRTRGVLIGATRPLT